MNAIDINISAPTLFPHLSGGPVSFHADFNAFSTAPIFTSDGLPTNTALSAASFDQSSVTLLPPTGFVTGSSLTSFSISVVNQPTVAGDFNNNGIVDAADYVVWRTNAGTTNALPNDNGIGGIVREVHYDLWHAHFGVSVAAIGAADVSGAVPEPATHLLLILAAANACARRRRIRLQGDPGRSLARLTAGLKDATASQLCREFTWPSFVRRGQRLPVGSGRC